MKLKQLNFADAYIESLGTRQRHRKQLYAAAIALIVSAALLLLGFWAAANYFMVFAEYTSLKDYMESESVIAAGKEYEQINADVDKLNVELAYIKGIRERIASYPEIDKAVIDAIYDKCGTLIIASISYDRTTAALALSCIAQDDAAASKFVKRLYGTELCETIEYGGYRYDTTNKVYNFDIILTLKAVTKE